MNASLRPARLFAQLAVIVALSRCGAAQSTSPAAPEPQIAGDKALTASPGPVSIDGRLSEPQWDGAEAIRSFSFPWSSRPAPATEFRAWADADHLYFSFTAEDDDLVVETRFDGESTLDREDRVEIFFARDEAPARMFNGVVTAAKPKTPECGPRRARKQNRACPGESEEGKTVSGWRSSPSDRPLPSAAHPGAVLPTSPDQVQRGASDRSGLARYYCIEIDPLGRVHDYAAQHYRQFDSSWNCPGLRAAGTRGSRGYTVEAAVPFATLSDLMGRATGPGATLRIGLFRAEFRPGALGDAPDNWISWVRPATTEPDFHVPSAFREWRIPASSDEATPAFRTRGIVLVPDDLSLADWPDRAAQAGLTTIALHHGTSPAAVAAFIGSPPGRAFLDRCAQLGLEVEYELHAMNELLPRSLFAAEPLLFRMNEQGERTADANLCVHSARALEIVSTNALRLARQLRPTTGRYFFWGDDGLPWCRCPRCREFTESDQALILENHLVRVLRQIDPAAQLAHLAYHNTLPAPRRVKAEPGVFLEFAPIHRSYDKPYHEQTGPDVRDALAALEANLRVFPTHSAQVLEYWLDVSRFSGWKRPAVKLPWRRDVIEADAATYARLGIRHVTTFAVWIDADYVRRFGEPTALAEYGAALRNR
ncbi:MAG: DUF4838 domain-containing protein [Verrucomicrobia bacterium]|jgi:hypothetical protein|nr:DUF4838 domain-containing protein [Verrucomicrobiota bacterium]OQC67530.1 MAG: hypothetical protein BWX48_00688 [Verrucomicrobia bacterium ADurb.Bin006]MDI9379907.1 DUF4838 domain-containing protein [Verrucomicrobiota bacterium]NMD21314.1 DUF4838 domain-containing protein [Verrucomicrobiota bacterium]HNU98759.1 DUF4838 domain-containing protein [Verrucomicrobiota bacterium]